MIRKIVGASILVFSCLYCTTNDAAAQTASPSSERQVSVQQKGKIRITTVHTPLPQSQPLTAEKLKADIEKIESAVALSRQNPREVQNGTLAKREKALEEKKAALKALE